MSIPEISPHVEQEHACQTSKEGIVESTGAAGASNSNLKESQSNTVGGYPTSPIRMQRLTPELLGLTQSQIEAKELTAKISFKARMKSDGHKFSGGGGTQAKCCCPFHDDRTPSFCISKTDDYGRCFGCEWKGDIIQYERDFHHVRYPIALKRLHEWLTTGANGSGRSAAVPTLAKPFSFSVEQQKAIDEASGLLADDDALMERIAGVRQWNPETIRKLAQDRDLGWSADRLRFHYSTGIKVRDWPQHYFYWVCGGNGLWRDRLLDDAQEIYLTEGESDTIALLDCGLEQEQGVAVLAVPGANGFKKQWGERFRGKSVITCFDNDETGFNGVRLVHQILKPFTSSLRNHSLKGGA